MNLFDLERLDPEQFKVFAELQQLANRKRIIDKQEHVDPEMRQRQLNSLLTSVRTEFISSKTLEWKTFH